MVIAFQFSAAGSQVWTPEADLLLTDFGAIAASTSRAILSSDPNATTALFTAPSATSVDKNLLAYCNGGADPSSILIPVSAGEKIVVAISAQGSAVITAQNA